MSMVVIKGGEAGFVDLKSGELLEITNLEGQQVCDFFAFKADDMKEYLSTSHIRSALRRTYIKDGDFLISVFRNPMFKVVYDDVGVHDFCMAACDPQRYLLDYGVAEHRSCRCNLFDLMKDHDVLYEYLPDPVNLFQETSVTSKGLLVSGISPAKPGDRIVLEACMDVKAVGSACPQDLSPVNNYKPTDIRFRKLSPGKYPRPGI